MSDAKKDSVVKPLDNHATDIENVTTLDNHATGEESALLDTSASGGTVSPLDNHATDEKA